MMPERYPHTRLDARAFGQGHQRRARHASSAKMRPTWLPPERPHHLEPNATLRTGVIAGSWCTALEARGRQLAVEACPGRRRRSASTKAPLRAGRAYTEPHRRALAHKGPAVARWPSLPAPCRALRLAQGAALEAWARAGLAYPAPSRAGFAYT